MQGVPVFVTEQSNGISFPKTETVYTDNAGERAEVRELLYLTAVVQDAALPAASIEKTILPHALRPSP